MRNIHFGFHLKKSSVLALALMLGLGTVISLPTIRRASASSMESRTARPAPIRLSATHNPYVKFEAGYDLSDVSPEAEAAAVRPASGQPLALAAADFDEDGVPDLLAGQQHGLHGLLTLYRGNDVSAGAPALSSAEAAKARLPVSEAPFHAASRVLETPEAPAFIAAGDFNADGHQDALTAARNGNGLYLLAGDGHGDFGEAERISLPGQVTAMTSGEINRADGLADIVVAVNSGSGAQVLVFESPEGAAHAKAEKFPVLAPVSSLALEQLDQHYAMDLVIAAGRDLLLIKGRDRKLSQQEVVQESVAPATMERLSFPAVIVSATTGDFVWESDHRSEIALLTADNKARILQRSEATGRPSRHRRSDWSELPQSQNVTGKEIFAVRASGLPVDNLMIIDAETNQLHVLSGEAEKRFIDTAEILTASPATSQLAASLISESAPVAILPMRLNNDALTDLVMLRENRSAPSVILAATAAAFVVNSLADTNDGVCNAANCTLREAINAANASPGADTITFNPGSTFVQPVINLTAELPVITDPVTINGNVTGTLTSFRMQLNPPPVALTGGALKITAGSSTVTRLVIGGFRTEGIRIESNGGNTITDCRIGTNAAGTSANANGAGNNSNIVIFNSPNNTIGGTIVAARNIISGSGHGILIQGNASAGNKVQGNRIGTDVAGTASLQNIVGVFVLGAPNNTIGGTASGAGNLISGNGEAQSEGVGVILREEIAGSSVFQAAGNLVQGNFIGPNAAGTASLSPGQSGIVINGVANCTIGGTSVAARNVISGNARHGIFDQAGTLTTAQNLFQGNFIGVNATGSGALGNGFQGITLLGAKNEMIGGTVTGARNIISGNSQNGVLIINEEFEPLAAETEQPSASALVIITAENNQVQGNFIGTDVNGTAAVPNALNGVSVRKGARNNVIGGTSAASRNILSGNSGNGIEIDNAPNNSVQGNFIGTNSSGNAALANGRGISIINGSQSNLIGGSASTPGAAPGNVISGNNSDGIRIADASNNNQIQGNLIGTNANGTVAIGNGTKGVLVFSSSDTLIGGTVTGLRNVISGNSNNGIQLGSAANTVVQGNFIGTDITGNSAIGNNIGVMVLTAASTIGGASTGAGNVISGNRSHGVSLQAASCTVQGNRIGTNAAGTGALGNQAEGVNVEDDGNQIGGTVTGAGNIIAFNTGKGVDITDSTANRVNMNSIFANGGLGINLDGDSVAVNDAGDGDAGTNNLQNFPVITSAVVTGTVQGTLNSTPNTTFRIEIFVNDDCDASGNGEGKTFLTAINVTTNASGNATFSTNAGTLGSLKKITATATDPNGNTSEFSACRNVSLF